MANIADIEREKALKAQNTSTPTSIYRGGVDTPVKEEKKPLFTPKTAEEYKAMAENPANIKPQLPETDEEVVAGNSAIDNLMKAAGVTESGTPLGLEGSAPLSTTEKQSLIDKAKNKGTSWAEKQRTEAIENAALPEQRYDLAGKTLKDANEKGLAANRAIQNAEIPKWKRMTLNDVLFNPEYEGIRDSIVSQAVNARGANFLKGLAGKDSNYASAVDQFNKEQAERYSDAIADRDTRAADVQMADIEAANKRDVGETLQRADFDVDRELDRKGLLFDTETKRQVLNKMAENSQEFAKLYPNPEDRMLLTAYQQYLSGDATMIDSLMSVYGPELVERLGPLMDKMLGGTGEGDEFEGYSDITIGGKVWTPQQMGKLFYEQGDKGVDKLIQSVPLEEQGVIIDALEKNYGIKDPQVKRLRQNYDNRVANQNSSNQNVEETNDRASTLENDIAEIVNNSNLDEKQRRKQLEDLKNQLDADISKNLLADTPALKTARANLDNAIAKNNLAIEVKSINKPLQKNVKLNFDKKGNLNKEDADETLKYFAGLDWNDLINENTGSVTNRAEKLEAVKATSGYKDVLDFFKNPKVQGYAYDKTAGKYYKYAVNKFCEVFGGEPKDYGFLNVTW